MTAAEVMPLRGDRPGTYTAAIEAYLVSAGVGESSKRPAAAKGTTATRHLRDPDARDEDERR
jgi:hypothetical protein